jgi:polyisoprenoid-binding protein YceI
MSKFTVSVFVLATIVSSVSWAAQPLKLDQEKSKIEFIGKKADGQHTGGFKKFEAQATADFEEPKNGTLVITIDATSLWSDDKKLTEHLKNPDFFDVRKYPKIVFEMTAIEGDEKEATLTGKLTMLGKDVEIKVPCKVEVGDGTIGVDADFKIDRTQWGMTYGAGKIENDVAIKANLEFKF